MRGADLWALQRVRVFGAPCGYWIWLRKGNGTVMSELSDSQSVSVLVGEVFDCLFVLDNKFERVRKWKEYRTLFTLGLTSVFGSPN